MTELVESLAPAVKLFLFAGASENVRLEALSSGVLEVLQKPYDLSKLAYLVKREARRNEHPQTEISADKSSPLQLDPQ